MTAYQRLLDISHTGKPTDAYHMVQLATRLYKQWYGAYPERVGLDWFTRMGEYADMHGETYVATELVGEPPMKWTPGLMLAYERIGVFVVPALFGKPEYYPDAPIIKHPPEKGRDEVLCERDGHTVFMTIWFTENGYDCIAWDEWKEEKE